MRLALGLLVCLFSLPVSAMDTGDAKPPTQQQLHELLNGNTMNGEWDGRPVRDVPPETWSRWRTDLSLRPPGGETLEALGDRVRGALEALAGEASGHVVVVSHVSPIKAAVAWSLGVGDEVTWRTRLTTGSYSRVDLAGPSLTAFNVVPD